MSVLVLGAGVIGVTTAYQLAKRGHEVTVIDRKDDCATECSYANGGQLSYSHAEPWASPAVLPKIPHWLWQEHSPLVFRLRMDPAMWLWAMKFLMCCTEKKAVKATENMLRLALYSRQCLEAVEAYTHVQFQQSQKGILHIFRDELMMEANVHHAEFQKKLGCDFTLLASRQECETLEPALKHAPARIVGGIHFPMDGTGDVYMFTQELKKYLQEKHQVKFVYNTSVEQILVESYEVTGVKTDKGLMKADAYVACLGAAAPKLLHPLGIKLPIYPMKGYSISIPIADDAEAPTVGITDQGNKIVFSRLGNILRVAGTAEFAGYDDSVNDNRIATLKTMAKETFPDCGDYNEATTWACLRPQIPDGSPVLGRSPYRKLFLNAGHGTLGWTLACGSAKIVADILEGGQPDISLKGLDMARFG